ncbi:MAG: GNAT family N-acetyltransferase [Candidatus Omnitrophota bacterium]
MNKLYVFQDGRKNDYSKELECAYKTYGKGSPKSKFRGISVDKLIDHSTEVIISNGLPKNWYFILKGLNIVTITLDRLDKHLNLADIVIDFKSQDSNRYFTGPDYSIRNNKDLEFDSIANLIKKLEWDSGFFGFPVALLSSRYLTENIMHRIEKFIKRENIRLVEYLCNCHDSRSVKIAEKNGFHFADIRLSFEKVLREKHGPQMPKAIRFGKADKKDVRTLKHISEDLYKDSRYFFDTNFNRSKINEFYQNWIEKAVLGKYDDECFCLYTNGVPVAFCSLKYNIGSSVTIGLLGLSNEYQGKGLGKVLLYSIFDMLIDRGVSRVSVVTQGRNYAAQRLYQNVGFLTKATELWYHKWI